MKDTSRMQKSGLRPVAAWILCCVLLCTTTSCGFRLNPTGDWEYRDLPNGYELWRINVRSIILMRGVERGASGAHGDTLIPAYISAVCHNDRYIAVRWTDPADIDFDNLEDHDFSAAGYYIVDTADGTLYGPYETEEGFLSQCELLQAGGLSEWIDVPDILRITGDAYDS